jgi:dihydroorotate dehydrogenase (NAD+) catalytic subunit
LSAMVAAPPHGVDLRTDLAGLALEHPVLNGSGTFDAIAALRAFGDTLRDAFPFSAFVSKTITVAPRGGNPGPRLWETPAGLINSIGLPNKGLEGFLDQDLPVLATLPVPLIVSVAGFSRDEFAALVEGVAARPEVAALELNVSCPNVKSGCVIGTEVGEMDALMRRVRPLTPKPLIVKLTPNVAQVGPVARAAEAEGADALSAINTLRATAVDPRSG